MTDERLDEIKTKWNIPVTLPMSVPWGKDDVVLLVQEVERLRAALDDVMGACDAECAGCGAYYVAKRALDAIAKAKEET